MTPERWRVVTEIFHAALTRASGERPSYLAAACGQNASLRADVDALLAGDGRASVLGDPLAMFHGALSPGTVVGPYRVEALLDAGGMGEVYKARDTRLNRDVAVKVLPIRNVADPDRLVHFDREAHAAAALNHPNICSIFDVGVHEGAPFIVSELLEGQTLRQACAAGPLALRRALEYAVSIARGLAAAHVKGIVHRDLKPENVFITTEGRVKILDFGLAMPMLAVAGEAPPATGRPLTEVGTVVGTIGYMSPEQVRGLPADSRSDIFSFGTVLFEMLAGRPPFHGDTAADTMSAILHEEPPALVPERRVPSDVDRIIRRCLEKAPSNRFQSADDLAFALETVTVTPSAATAPAVAVPKVSARLLRPVVLTALTVVAAAVAAEWYSSPQTVNLGAYTFTPFATDAAGPNFPAWSPDNRSLAYDASLNGHRQIFVRSLDSDSAVQISHGPNDASRPFWWPDGGRIGYLSAGKVWSVSLAGGEPELVQKYWVGAATLSPDGRTLATWRDDVSTNRWGVWLASPPNGVPREYTPAPFKIKNPTVPNFLHFSPDGRQLLLSDWTDAGDSAIWLLPFPDGGSQPHRLVPKVPTSRLYTEMPTQLAWMPDSRRAVMVFHTSSAPHGGLWIVDVQTGAAIPVSMGLTQYHNPNVSHESKLAFTAGGPGYDLAEVPLNGSPMRDFLATGSDEYSGAWVPGTSRYVYLTNKNGEQELRIHSQAENSDRLIVGLHTFGGTALNSPVASPDGQRVAYEVWGVGGGFGSIWISPVGGGEPTRLTREVASETGAAWSPDGLSIAYYHEQGGLTGLALFRVGSNDPPRILVGNIPGATIPAWSPDGKWIAYRTLEAVGSTPAGVQLVSPDGTSHRFLTTSLGRAFVWSRDGGSLYSARRTDDRMEVIALDPSSGAVRVISTLDGDFAFATPDNVGLRFTLAPDGQSFLATIMRRRAELWILENFELREGILDWFRQHRAGF